jgi:glyoxylase-like metal-dependent hydrolase (beta-lactamase superfamily II)
MAPKIRRLHIGHVTAPDGHPLAGKLVVISAFLIEHKDGMFLFDTGIGVGTPELDAYYKTVRRDILDVLADAGAEPADVRLIANCHLHFDHSGGNIRFPKVPIFTQKTEFELANEPDYTLPEQVYDFEGATFELFEGEAEPMPGIRIIPTPGHTAGHQSVVVDTEQGRVVLAGQAVDRASDYAAVRYGWRRGTDAPEWIERFESFDPVRVLFAHDLAIWERAQGPAPVS